MQLIDGDGPRILAVDLAGVKSINEALRRCIVEAEDVLVEVVQRDRTLSAVRNEAVTDLKDKYKMRGSHA